MLFYIKKYIMEDDTVFGHGLEGSWGKKTYAKQSTTCRHDPGVQDLSPTGVEVRTQAELSPQAHWILILRVPCLPTRGEQIPLERSLVYKRVILQFT